MPTHKILTDISVGGTVFGTAAKFGRDADNLIDFTTDNQIKIRVNGTNEIFMNSDRFAPSTNDGYILGGASNQWSDLFLASGAVINFNNGDVTITHASNQLTFAGGKTTINSLELGAADHVIEDGANILDENDNSMMSFASGVANITGNAATATVLATARTIGGVSFNGSANINLPGVNTSGNQDTSGNAATATALTSGNKTIAGVLDITDTTDSSDATGDTGALRCEGGASIAKKLYAGSTITGSADVIAYSDQKLKENVKTLDGKKVLEMRGVSFDRVDTGKASSGVIAQEMEKVAPELVIDDGKYKGVAYGNIVGYLIEAIKDQQKQIDELKENCCGCSK